MDFLENTTKVSKIYWINCLFFAIDALLQLQCATKIILIIIQLASQMFQLALKIIQFLNQNESLVFEYLK